MSSVIPFPTIQGPPVSYVAGGLTVVISLDEPMGPQKNGESNPSALYEQRLPNGNVVYSTADGIRGLIQAIVAGQVAANQADTDNFLRAIKARWSLQSKFAPGKNRPYYEHRLAA
ncbi:hypothetical protein [Burkholderia gladioli]|uniref:hypothetical protein n=1 Tax=Burkholderia gladioli TaxID=28095 RepID=UPI00163F8E9B|nr:hypothetical protein [Burkholderia gladioli]